MILHKVPTMQRHLKDTRGRRKTPKYLGKSCYCHIKCIVPTLMAAFMQSRPLNSVSQEIIIQKKLKKKSGGTNTQMVAQMMNKYRGRMVQGDYIMGNIFHKEGIGRQRRRTVAIIIRLVLCLRNLYEHLPPRIRSLSMLAVVQFTKTQFFDLFFTNLFYQAH